MFSIHTDAAPNLADRAFGHIRRGDLLGIDLGKTVELERILKPFPEAAYSFGKTLAIFLDQLRRSPAGALPIGLKPDLFQMGREAPFFLVRNLGQDVPPSSLFISETCEAEMFSTPRA
ncbi:MAG: hypothetical protein R6X21_02705 [Candidatus Aminicenantes bacterium]